MATNDSAAMIQCSRSFKARLAMRSSASMTITSTAALMPKKTASTIGHVTECGVNHRQRQHDNSAGQHEQQSRCEATFKSVQPPPDIRGKLHRLGARQQHAEAQRAEEVLLIEPLFLVDDDPVRQGNLRRRSAETQNTDASPDSQRLPETYAPKVLVRAHGYNFRSGHGWPPPLLLGQLCVSSDASRHQR